MQVFGLPGRVIRDAGCALPTSEARSLSAAATAEAAGVSRPTLYRCARRPELLSRRPTTRPGTSASSGHPCGMSAILRQSSSPLSTGCRAGASAWLPGAPPPLRPRGSWTSWRRSCPFPLRAIQIKPAPDPIRGHVRGRGGVRRPCRRSSMDLYVLPPRAPELNGRVQPMQDLAIRTPGHLRPAAPDRPPQPIDRPSLTDTIRNARTTP